MNKILENLTIISISYNNEDELLSTLKSYNDCLNNGAKSIIINGGKSFNENIFHDNVLLIQEKDYGIFDALNKGIKYVNTKYFILIHSGDKFISNSDYLQNILNKMNIEELDIILGDQTIPLMNFKRKHSARLWSPLFLNFGAQPPHMPTIYKTSFVNNIQYDIKNKIIADFFYFKDIFSKNPKWSKYNESLIEMGAGGTTTNGFSSFVLVSKEFIKNYGFLKGLLISIIRIPLKFTQMI